MTNASASAYRPEPYSPRREPPARRSQTGRGRALKSDRSWYRVQTQGVTDRSSWDPFPLARDLLSGSLSDYAPRSKDSSVQYYLRRAIAAAHSRPQTMLTAERGAMRDGAIPGRGPDHQGLALAAASVAARSRSCGRRFGPKTVGYRRRPRLSNRQ